MNTVEYHNVLDDRIKHAGQEDLDRKFTVNPEKIWRAAPDQIGYKEGQRTSFKIVGNKTSGMDLKNSYIEMKFAILSNDGDPLTIASPFNMLSSSNPARMFDEAQLYLNEQLVENRKHNIFVQDIEEQLTNKDEFYKHDDEYCHPSNSMTNGNPSMFHYNYFTTDFQNTGAEGYDNHSTRTEITGAVSTAYDYVERNPNFLRSSNQFVDVGDVANQIIVTKRIPLHRFFNFVNEDVLWPPMLVSVTLKRGYDYDFIRSAKDSIKDYKIDIQSMNLILKTYELTSSGIADIMKPRSMAVNQWRVFFKDISGSNNMTLNTQAGTGLNLVCMRFRDNDYRACNWNSTFPGDKNESHLIYRNTRYPTLPTVLELDQSNTSNTIDHSELVVHNPAKQNGSIYYDMYKSIVNGKTLYNRNDWIKSQSAFIFDICSGDYTDSLDTSEFEINYSGGAQMRAGQQITAIVLTRRTSFVKIDPPTGQVKFVTNGNF